MILLFWDLEKKKFFVILTEVKQGHFCLILCQAVRRIKGCLLIQCIHFWSQLHVL